jgi:hypothetical protein
MAIVVVEVVEAKTTIFFLEKGSFKNKYLQKSNTAVCEKTCTTSSSSVILYIHNKVLTRLEKF